VLMAADLHATMDVLTSLDSAYLVGLPASLTNCP